MSSSTQAVAKSGPPDLASRIYVELVGRAFLRAENTAVIKPDPAELAKLSIQLAATFYKLEKIANAALGPQNVGYEVEVADIGNWNK